MKSSAKDLVWCKSPLDENIKTKPNSFRLFATEVLLYKQHKITYHFYEVPNLY